MPLNASFKHVNSHRWGFYLCLRKSGRMKRVLCPRSAQFIENRNHLMTPEHVSRMSVDVLQKNSLPAASFFCGWNKAVGMQCHGREGGRQRELIQIMQHSWHGRMPEGPFWVKVVLPFSSLFFKNGLQLLISLASILYFWPYMFINHQNTAVLSCANDVSSPQSLFFKNLNQCFLSHLYVGEGVNHCVCVCALFCISSCKLCGYCGSD